MQEYNQNLRRLICLAQQKKFLFNMQVVNFISETGQTTIILNGKKLSKGFEETFLDFLLK